MRSLGEHGGGVDVTLDQRAPAPTLNLSVDCVQVRIQCSSVRCHCASLQDYGELETSMGTTVNLARNTRHLLRRIDCEPLIRQGVLEELD